MVEGLVLQRVADGETLTVTMDGQAIAELRPVPARAIPAATLLKRWRPLSPGDAGTRETRVAARDRTHGVTSATARVSELAPTFRTTE